MESLPFEVSSYKGILLFLKMHQEYTPGLGV